MTVEQLLELLQEQDLLDLVFVDLNPCIVGGPPNLREDSQEGEAVSMYSVPRKGRVYIEACGHDC